MTATVTKIKTKKPTAATTPIAEVHLVPLELIDVHKQTRTEFDEETIAELAADIAARGMMQPVLLNPTPDGRFTMIAGERRLRATYHNGQTRIPALLTKVTDDEAMLMQLAENVQREELSLEDEINAITKLYEMLGSLKEVAKRVNKSVSWCSKRHAFVRQLTYQVSTLLTDGTTEDMELLQALNSLTNHVSPETIYDWCAKIRKGEAGRNEVRAALKQAKEAKKTPKAPEKVSHAKTETPPLPPTWTLANALEEIDEALNYIDAEPALDIYRKWTDEQRQEFNTRLAARYAEGSEKRGNGEHLGLMAIRNVVFNSFYETKVFSIEVMAMIQGFAEADMNVEDMLTKFQVKEQ